MKVSLASTALACLAVFVSDVPAQVIAPSTYTTAIQLRDEPAGMEFNDWAGIPVALTDAADNPGGFPVQFVDIKDVQIANDANNLFIRVTTYTTTIAALGSGMYLAFDLDQNTSTGFDVFALGEIGSELGYITDYPYEQATGTFNNGNEGVVDFGGDFIGLALTNPFYVSGPPLGVQMEWTIPLNLAVGPTGPGRPLFTGTTFDLMVWNDQGAGDVTEVITYTLATPPGGLPGDANADGKVDLLDLDILGANFGVLTGATLAQGDFNNDDAVNLLDLDILGANFGNMAPATVGVPEPASALAAVVGFAALLARRARG